MFQGDFWTEKIICSVERHVLELHTPRVCSGLSSQSQWSAVELDSPGQIGLKLRADSWLSPVSGL